MTTLIEQKMLYPDHESSVSMNISHAPGTDGALEITRVDVNFCMFCGKPVGRYTLPDPAPVITRALANKNPCNDVSCRFCISDTAGTLKCAFAYRNIGCYMVDQTAKDAVNSNHDSIVNAENATIFVSVG